MVHHRNMLEMKMKEQNTCDPSVVLENDIVMSSSLFMLITYYSIMTDTNE